MVSLKDVQASNAALKSNVSGLVALFIGATSGIGQTSLFKLVQYTASPKVYIAGRRESAVAEIQAKLKELNAGGEYIFVKAADLSLLRVVDQTCDFVKKHETKLDLLWLSAGYLSVEGRQETPEGLDACLSIRYYSRMRFIYNLLPLLNEAPNPRVVSVLAGGGEGKIFPDDLKLEKNYGFVNCATVSPTYMTLCMEKFAEENPKVSFVHYYPGLVKTNAMQIKGLGPIPQFLIDWVLLPLLTPMCVSIDETGERGLYHATSDRYPPAKSASGSPESGFHGLNWNGEPAPAEKVLKPLRENGMKDKIYEHTMAEFDRIAAL